MYDPRMLKPHTHDDRSAPPGAGSAAAWLAHCGMVALLVVEESSATRDENTTVQSAATLAQEPADPTPDREPEEALLIRLSAQKLWAEGRANPVWFECRSWIGDWQTDDRVTWRTTDGVWLAQLQRSPNGRRVFLRLWRGQTFVGHQDDAGWHPAAARSRSRQSRPVQRTLPLPLAG